MTACVVPAVLVLLPAGIVLAFTMLPTAAALCVDRGRVSWLALSVGPLNLCGAVFPLLTYWKRGHGFEAAFEVLADPYSWLTALTGAALGWTIYLAMPGVVLRLTAVKQQLRLSQLRASQAALTEEWGREISDSAGDADEQA